MAGAVGLPPGTPAHVGERPDMPTQMTLHAYNPEDYTRSLCPPESCGPPAAGETRVLWYDVVGLHDVAALKAIAEHFSLHPLVLEDVLDTTQRPKVQELGTYLFVELQALTLNATDMTASQQQCSLILGQGFVLSFRETSDPDLFYPLIVRLENEQSRLRHSGADYLFYALIDVIVDRYFDVLEGLGEAIELLEEGLTDNPTPGTLQSIRAYKREMILLRRAVWPLREIIDNLARRVSGLIGREIEIYFRDVYDHVIQLMDTIEILRDILSGMLDIYLSAVSNRLNEVMKVLTIIATLFIPLTFIAGVYGMNFRYMPELTWRWGYPVIWAVMIAQAVTMLIYFRRKGWI